ncbi:hypothetical protein BV20DRAFT_1052845 [Pilatotrama ljubarskyi]|nr:hypothetical protein BV20DRAFT_1052845 [Pilatotrama ljubarskyi]
MADTATPCHAKEPFAPITLNVPIEGPSSIPSPGKVSHAVVGGQCRIIKPLPKLRTTQPPTRPLLLKAGRPGAVASARQGEPSDEVILYRRTTRHKSHFDEESRYIPRFVYEAGDRVLVNDCEGTRPVWRHGVIADFKEWPPVFEVGASSW